MSASRTLSSGPYTETVDIVRGDRYDRTVQIAIDGVDFAGAEVSIHVRETPTGPLLYDAGADALIDTDTEGEMEIVFAIPGATSAQLPDRCTLDLRFELASADLGPVTVVRLQFRVTDGYVQES